MKNTNNSNIGRIFIYAIFAFAICYCIYKICMNIRCKTINNINTLQPTIPQTTAPTIPQTTAPTIPSKISALKMLSSSFLKLNYSPLSPEFLFDNGFSDKYGFITKRLSDNTWKEINRLRFEYSTNLKTLSISSTSNVDPEKVVNDLFNIAFTGLQLYSTYKAIRANSLINKTTGATIKSLGNVANVLNSGIYGVANPSNINIISGGVSLPPLPDIVNRVNYTEKEMVEIVESRKNNEKISWLLRVPGPEIDYDGLKNNNPRYQERLNQMAGKKPENVCEPFTYNGLNALASNPLCGGSVTQTIELREIRLQEQNRGNIHTIKENIPVKGTASGKALKTTTNGQSEYNLNIKETVEQMQNTVQKQRVLMEEGVNACAIGMGEVGMFVMGVMQVAQFFQDIFGSESNSPSLLQQIVDFLPNEDAIKEIVNDQLNQKEINDMISHINDNINRIKNNMIIYIERKENLLTNCKECNKDDQDKICDCENIKCMTQTNADLNMANLSIKTSSNDTNILYDPNICKAPIVNENINSSKRTVLLSMLTGKDIQIEPLIKEILGSDIKLPEGEPYMLCNKPMKFFTLRYWLFVMYKWEYAWSFYEMFISMYQLSISIIKEKVLVQIDWYSSSENKLTRVYESLDIADKDKIGKHQLSNTLLGTMEGFSEKMFYYIRTLTCLYFRKFKYTFKVRQTDDSYQSVTPFCRINYYRVDRTCRVGNIFCNYYDGTYYFDIKMYLTNLIDSNEIYIKNFNCQIKDIRDNDYYFIGMLLEIVEKGAFDKYLANEYCTRDYYFKACTGNTPGEYNFTNGCFAKNTDAERTTGITDFIEQYKYTEMEKFYKMFIKPQILSLQTMKQTAGIISLPFEITYLGKYKHDGLNPTTNQEFPGYILDCTKNGNIMMKNLKLGDDTIKYDFNGGYPFGVGGLSMREYYNIKNKLDPTSSTYDKTLATDLNFLSKFAAAGNLYPSPQIVTGNYTNMINTDEYLLSTNTYQNIVNASVFNDPSSAYTEYTENMYCEGDNGSSDVLVSYLIPNLSPGQYNYMNTPNEAYKNITPTKNSRIAMCMNTMTNTVYPLKNADSSQPSPNPTTPPSELPNYIAYNITNIIYNDYILDGKPDINAITTLLDTENEFAVLTKPRPNYENSVNNCSYYLLLDIQNFKNKTPGTRPLNFTIFINNTNPLVYLNFVNDNKSNVTFTETDIIINITFDIINKNTQTIIEKVNMFGNLYTTYANLKYNTGNTINDVRWNSYENICNRCTLNGLKNVIIPSICFPNCPDGWKDNGNNNTCTAPSSYNGGCSKISGFRGYTDAQKLDWSKNCKAPWTNNCNISITIPPTFPPNKQLPTFPPNKQLPTLYSFNNSMYMDIPHVPSLNIQGRFTIEFWYMSNDSNFPAYSTIIDKGTYCYCVQMRGNNQVAFCSGGPWAIFTIPALLPSVWYHFSLSYVSGSLKLFVYKNKVDSIQYSNAIIYSSGPTSNDTGRVNIGRQSPTTCSCNLLNNARLFDLRLWNVILSQTDIEKNLYLIIDLNSNPSLVANYLMTYDSRGVYNRVNRQYNQVMGKLSVKTLETPIVLSMPDAVPLCLAKCPDGWTDNGNNTCKAPSSYNGGCSNTAGFQGYTDTDKLDWSIGCKAPWTSNCVKTGVLSTTTAPPNLVQTQVPITKPCLANCPDGWTEFGSSCLAPPSYKGGCASQSGFTGYTPEQKLDWSKNCNAPWTNKCVTTAPTKFAPTTTAPTKPVQTTTQCVIS